MRATIFFPARDVSHKHARSHDVFNSSTKSLQGVFDVSDALFRLFIRVAFANDLTVGAECGCTRDVDSITDFRRTRVANNRFPLRAG